MLASDLLATYDEGALLAQAVELCAEQFMVLLIDCEDDDVVRPEMVFEAMRSVWAPNSEIEWPELTAGEVREKFRATRGQLAQSSSQSGPAGKGGAGSTPPEEPA